ncbi:MAG: dehydrogenase, short-chain alcohol dehydrogenase like [Acidimicrobiales bacterium]|nr:dehydrogenase, short-chain alcohol dehydrogenase like [Acidimicrobiales bacterium]
METLDGYGVLVTGGGSGIGLGCARRLLAGGAASVTIAGRSKDRLQSAAAEVGDDRLHWVAADVTDEDAVRDAVAAATDNAGGRLDGVVASAGGSEHMGPLTLADVDKFRSVLDVNVVGTFLTLKHAAPVMARAGRGSFVGISSIAGAITHRYLGPYCVGKAGIDMLVKVAADELGASGIRVNSIRPGLIATELVAGITAGGPVLDDYLAQMPIARVGTVDDIAGAAAYLIGPESTWVTGQVIAVDGGQTLRRGPDYTSFAEPVFGADALRGLVGEG